MYRAPFVGRSRELEVLDNLWNSSKATLLILYGRRRVGKTRLLTHWLQQQGRNGLYWVAEPASALTQLRSFSQALMTFIDPEVEVPPDFTFASWELAFRQLALYAQKRRLVLFIDEVTYLVDVNPEFVGLLQKVWDRWLSDSNLMLALAGSQMGLMRRHLLDYEAPLHGRATAQMNLPPLPYGTTRDYFPDYSAEERVILYAMWGGVPAYWERLDPKESIIENLRRNILPAHSWMVDESRILLQDFITDLHNYVGIMRAIADGQQAISDISERTGLTSSKASFYLSVLRDTGFVVREVPISQRDIDSRRGRYFVTDPYLRFFYRFLSAYQSKLALGQSQQILEIIQEGLPDFIRDNTWKELCRVWLLLASARGEIPVPMEEVGSEWARSYSVDVVGISDADRGLVLGDCYWGNQPLGLEAVEELLKKTPALVPKKDSNWSIYYVIFSSCGWTNDARAQAEQMVMDYGRRRRWQTKGIRLLDLAELDNDLIQWSV
ncbi:MAG: ATP-binding protein [Chloroflexi bacterium]|nr:ATP-binding protein [Chloroflexota bacterium]MCI0730606.1 ATP-binding protein [Chloroflexota bacterium]